MGERFMSNCDNFPEVKFTFLKDYNLKKKKKLELYFKNGFHLVLGGVFSNKGEWSHISWDLFASEFYDEFLKLYQEKLSPQIFIFSDLPILSEPFCIYTASESYILYLAQFLKKLKDVVAKNDKKESIFIYLISK